MAAVCATEIEQGLSLKSSPLRMTALDVSLEVRASYWADFSLNPFLRFTRREVTQPPVIRVSETGVK